MSHKIKKICIGILGIAAFYALFLAVCSLFVPLFTELYLYMPFVFFAPIAFFFTMFLARETVCLVFMPKPRLKAIIRDGQAEVSASQVVLKVFSWAFLGRIFMYFGLFVLEMICRLVAINLFLLAVNAALPMLEAVSETSDMLLIAILAISAFVMMELPWYALFYRVSFGGRANRRTEYRFGLKAFAFMVAALIVQLLLQPLSIRFADSTAAQYLLLALWGALSFGIWVLMYKKPWKQGNCPLCNRVKSCIERYKKPDGMRDKAAETPIEEQND